MPTNAAAVPKLISGAPPPAGKYDADIIILTLNRPQETREAVQSARNQKMLSFHVSVLDQGSTPENQLALADAFNKFSDTSYFTSTKNLGVGGGRNFLTNSGQGRFIIALDNDATFSDDLVVYHAMRAFDDDPNLGAVGFNILSRDGGKIDDSSWGYPIALKHRSEETFRTTTFVGAGHAIRRETWDDAGGYDGELYFTWEEYDFSLRAIARGWTISYAGSLRVLHKTSAEERVKWTSGRAQLFVRNRLMIGRKWHIPWLFLLPRIVGYLVNGSINRHLWGTMIGVFQAICADGYLIKHQMTQEMRGYIRENELQHRGSVSNRLMSEVFKLRDEMR